MHAQKHRYHEWRKGFDIGRYHEWRRGFDIKSAGDMNTGSRFHRFSTNAARDILASLINDESAREPFKEVHLHLCAIVRVLNSQH